MIEGFMQSFVLTQIKMLLRRMAILTATVIHGGLANRLHPDTG